MRKILSHEWTRLPMKVMRDDFYYRDLFLMHYECDLPVPDMTEEEIAEYVTRNLEKVYKFINYGEI